MSDAISKAFGERCKTAQGCIPESPFRDQLERLHNEMLDAIEALKAEQQRGEPVAWADENDLRDETGSFIVAQYKHIGYRFNTPLYLHPEQARQDGKQTRSQLPEGIDRVRNAATGEIQARQDGILTLLHQAYEAYNDGLDWTGDMIDDYERITAAKEQL